MIVNERITGSADFAVPNVMRITENVQTPIAIRWMIYERRRG